MRIPIKPPPRITEFVVLSVALHAAVFSAYTLLPDKRPVPVEESKPVKVTYLPQPEKEKIKEKLVPKKPPQFVEAPQPEKVEQTKIPKLISKSHTRPHSKAKKIKKEYYASKKTLIPKPKSEYMKPRKKILINKDFMIPPPKEQKKLYDVAKKGFDTPKPESVPKKAEAKTQFKSTTELLEELNTEKYASIETLNQDADNFDDEEVISLDTQETKYASYFARIKRQIELVWGYPEEAARNGVTGQLLLRFQITRDGKLQYVKMVNSSGSLMLDDAALEAVNNAAPYYPFPVTIDREKLSILATFIYSPSYTTYYQEKLRK